MLNQIVLVGRLVKKPTILEQEKKAAIITLAVPRNFKNENGEYETDFIDCTLLGGVAEQTCEYCEKGDLVGVRGRIQNLNDTAQLQIVAEKVTFLSSKPKED